MVACGTGALGACCLCLGICTAEATFLRLRDVVQDLGEGFHQDGVGRLAEVAVQGERLFEAGAHGPAVLGAHDEVLDEEDSDGLEELTSEEANLSQAIVQELRDLAVRGYNFRPTNADRLAERAALGGDPSQAGKVKVVELGASPQEPAYAYEQYSTGQVVEGLAKNGSWLPAVVVFVHNQTFDIHVADDYPGFDVKNVSHSLLRRPLLPGEADYLADNSELQHKGHGIKYRHSKHFGDTSAQYVAWGKMVVGADEGDGWIKAKQGYLPFTVHNARVLVKTERKGDVIVTSEEVPGMMHNEGAYFEVSDFGEFLLRNGSWFPCRITGLGWARNTYDIIVMPTEYVAVPIVNVPVSRLRRIAPAPPRPPQHFPAPDCQHEGGCIVLRVKVQRNKAAGHDLLVHLSRKSDFHLIMKMVCSKLKITWESCQNDYHYQHRGKQVDPLKNITANGLYNEAVLLMMERPPSTAAH